MADEPLTDAMMVHEQDEQPCGSHHDEYQDDTQYESGKYILIRLMIGYIILS